MKGILGYGRYDDDLQHVGCPRAATDMTPCVARDGSLACTDAPEALCVGCGKSPSALLGGLQSALGKEVRSPYAPTRHDAADQLRVLVREVTAPFEDQGLAVDALPEIEG